MDHLPPPRISLLVHAPAPSTLVPVLELLLEPSTSLSALLAPQLQARLADPDHAKPTSYRELLDVAAEIVARWDVLDQADFVASHPRIGEVNGLSKSSESEQGTTSGQEPTSGHVLRRLTMLNAYYEEMFPNLRFITFVNGRSRAEIVPELEGILGLNLAPPSQDQGEARFTELRKGVKIQPIGSGPWRKELERDVNNMWQIAHSRLAKMGVE
ncbi:hypothetical protein JCM3766R1_001475 [Sporobolomyces carnicolor]